MKTIHSLTVQPALGAAKLEKGTKGEAAAGTFSALFESLLSGPLGEKAETADALQEGQLSEEEAAINEPLPAETELPAEASALAAAVEPKQTAAPQTGTLVPAPVAKNNTRDNADPASSHQAGAKTAEKSTSDAAEPDQPPVQQKLQPASTETAGLPVSQADEAQTEEPVIPVPAKTLAEEKQIRRDGETMQKKVSAAQPFSGLMPRIPDDITIQPVTFYGVKPETGILQSAEAEQPVGLPSATAPLPVQPAPAAALMETLPVNIPAEAAKAPELPAQAEKPLPPPVPTVRLANLTEQLSEMMRGALRFSAGAEGSQLRINLTPEHLGHLDIRLTETNNKIAAQILTSSAAAKEAIELQLNQLRTAFAQQGLVVEKITITHQTSQQPFSEQHAHQEQRFSQKQRGDSSARGQHTYEQPAEKRENPAVNSQMKVDYTV